MAKKKTKLKWSYSITKEGSQTLHRWGSKKRTYILKWNHWRKFTLIIGINSFEISKLSTAKKVAQLIHNG